MSILAANPCRSKAPTIWTLDTINDLDWIKQPNDGDLAILITTTAFQIWRFESHYTGELESPYAIAGGCQGAWVLAQTDQNVLNLITFGADPTGTTDSTDAIQQAIDLAISLGGAEISAPAGLYLHSGLTVGNGVSIVGEGSGREGFGGVTILKYTGSGVSIQAQTPTLIFNFSLRHLSLYGTDGQGGVGLLLDSFTYSYFEDILFSKFRNGANGYALRMINNNGNCAYNRFIATSYEDSDTAIELESTNGANATGYNQWYGTVIYREIDCILLKDGLGNGGNYNLFSGLNIQGSPSLAAGRYIYIEGHGNKFDAVNIDQSVAGDDLLVFALTNTADNYIQFIGGFEIAKYTNNQTTGAENVVDFGGYFTHSPGKRFVMFDPTTTAGTELAIRSKGTNGVEIHLGNEAAGSQAWRMAMATGATPNFEIHNAGTRLWTLNWSSGGVEMVGNLSFPNGQSVRFADTAGLSEATLGVSGSNNAQVQSPTMGGDIQLINRAASGVINMLPAGAVVGVRIDGSVAAGNTRLMVYDVDSALLQRVKAGANGTGPGGVGRALYIDNI